MQSSHNVRPFLNRLRTHVLQTKTPEGKPYTLLSLPYFLAGKINDYIEWLIEEK